MKKKGLSIALAALMSVAAVSAFAGTTVNAVTGTPYTVGLTAATDGTNPVSQNTTTFDKYLVMDVNANVPNATFDFSIGKYDSTQAENAVLTGASGGNLAVINGVTTQSDSTALDFKANDATNTGSANAGEVKFVQTDMTVTEGATGADTAVVWTTATTAGDEKYAKKTLTLNFSTVQFTEPGVYRYLITETGTNQGITNDIGITDTTNKTYRTLDVYVEDYAGYLAAKEAQSAGSTSGYDPVNSSGKELLITGYVLYDGKHNEAPSATSTTTTGKSTSYTNSYTSYDLKFSKTVTGNQGSRDKYFAFTVEITGAVAGTVYDVSYENDSNDNTTDGSADVNIVAHPNTATTCIDTAVTQPTTLTVGNDGKVTQVFYLQHDQSIAIRGLAEGTKYTITEAVEDYTASAEVTGDGDGSVKDAAAASNIATSGIVSDTTTGIKGDTVVDYTNNRSGTIPTGVILSVAAPAGIGVAVVGGIIYLIAKRRKD